MSSSGTIDSSEWENYDYNIVCVCRECRTHGQSCYRIPTFPVRSSRRTPRPCWTYSTTTTHPQRRRSCPSIWLTSRVHQSPEVHRHGQRVRFCAGWNVCQLHHFFCWHVHVNWRMCNVKIIPLLRVRMVLSLILTSAIDYASWNIYFLTPMAVHQEPWLSVSIVTLFLQ